MKLKLFLCILSIFCFSTSLFAKVSDTEQAMSDTKKADESPQIRYAHPHNSGGYKTDVKLLDRRNTFVNNRFSAKDFTLWLALYQQAAALDFYQELITKKQIQPDGEVLISEVTFGNITKEQGDLVELEDIYPFIISQYTPNKLLSELEKNEILNSSGYIVFPKDFKIDPDQMDFSFLLPKLQNLAFQLQDSRLRTDLLNELISYMMTQCTVVVVTQEEVTRYESRNSDFFASIFESVAGNAIGSVIHPDRIKEVKQKVNWTPNVNIFEYYPMFSIGFNQYPFARNAYGLLILNGKQNYPDVSLLYSRKLGDSYFSLDWHDRRLYAGSFMAKVGTFWEYGARADLLQDSTDTIGLYSGYVGNGTVSNAFIGQWLFGLTYNKSTKLDSLGLNWGAGFEWFFMPHFSLGVDGIGFVQPNWISRQNEWELSIWKCNLSFYADRYTFKSGYQWQKAGNDKQIMNQWFLSIGTSF